MEAMPEMTKIPWPQLNEFIYSCGSVWELYPFTEKIVTEIHRFCKYDQALVHFLDGNQNITDYHIVNMDERWNNAYMQYYSNVYPEKYGYLPASDVKEVKTTPVTRIYEWDRFPCKDLRQFL
jgi:hypothetical protein